MPLLAWEKNVSLFSLLSEPLWQSFLREKILKVIIVSIILFVNYHIWYSDYWMCIDTVKT